MDNGANVINVSLELRNPSSELERATNYAWEHGVLVIAAAGNDGSSKPVYPAFYQHALAVSASAGDRLATLSNYGDWVDIAAPGYQVYSTLPGNSYGCETGTSFAAAKVSGLAALLFGTIIDNNGDGRINMRFETPSRQAPCLPPRLAPFTENSISPELYRSLWERLNDLSGLTSQLDILHGSLLTPARKTRPT